MSSDFSTANLATDLRVLIVEDHLLLAEALARALREEPGVRVEAVVQSVRAAQQKLRTAQFDVVLLDYQLPDGDGLLAARYVITNYPRTRVIMVTAHEDRALLVEALEAGCSGFIAKSEGLAHLPNAIRSAMAGTTVLSPGMAKKLAEPTTLNRGTNEQLTDREIEVLRLLADGLSSPQIAERLFMSTHTLRNYFNRINGKLETHSKLGAVATALRLGIIDVARNGSRPGNNPPPVN